MSELSIEMLQSAIEMVANAPRRICGTTEPHVVHPKAHGWTNCANCFGACFVCFQESGCDGISHDIRCNSARYTPPEDSP